MLRGPMAEARTERISPRKLAAIGGGKPLSRALCGAVALAALSLAIDLRGNPLSHPDTAAVMQQVCAEHVVNLITDGDLACRHELCGVVD